jgi:predicted phosphodiesterase
MHFGALGDIHGDFEAARRAIGRHADVPFWISVGDIADGEGRYEELGAPVHWIKGNNENFDRIESGDLPSGLLYLPNGTSRRIGALTVAGLGGTLAPTMYELRADELPHPKKGTAKATELADRRRHFVREEVDALKRLKNVDVLLTHEAAEMKPRLHLFGHHHRFTEQERQGVRSVGLDLVSRSYLLIDGDSLEYEQVEVP